MSRLCRDCGHFQPWSFVAGMSEAWCRRPKRFDLARGAKTDPRTCAFERAKLWRWLGLDTCGPDGRYFVAVDRASNHRGPKADAA